MFQFRARHFARPSATITLALAGVLGVAASATAETETHAGTLQVSEGPSFNSIAVPRFDSQGGTRQLESVDLSLRSEVIGDLVTNGSGVSVDYDIRNSAGWSLAGRALGSTEAIVAGTVPNQSGAFIHFFNSDLLPVSDSSPAGLAAWTGLEPRSISADTNVTITLDPPDEIEVFVAAGLRWEVSFTWSPATPDPCPADVDGDGAVAFGDLLGVLEAWGPCRTECTADLNADGAVDLQDLLAVLAAWGPCPT